MWTLTILIDSYAIGTVFSECWYRCFYREYLYMAEHI